MDATELFSALTCWFAALLVLDASVTGPFGTVVALVAALLAYAIPLYLLAVAGARLAS
jgi:hypothetical protein